MSNLDAASDAATRGKATLQMGVDNTGFLIDRLGEDCHPLQFLRELTQNSIEAINDLPDKRGQIVWDVDWNNYDLTGVYKLAILDTGIGMTGEEMLKYINHLSASAHEQAHDKNFGVGAKVAAATRNHAGLIYLSWKEDEDRGSMTHLWRDPATEQYGVLRSERDDGTYRDFSHVTDDVKPDGIARHGTMVVLLGNAADEDTMQGPPDVASPSEWIARYLNTRYYTFPEGITVKARQGWKEPRSNTSVNVLRKVTGQMPYLNQHAQASGEVHLTRATARWWILKDEPALQSNSGHYASAGHMAALYQDELYEMVTGRSGVARLQMFGVIFGHNRVVIYLEPENGDTGKLTANTARTHLLFDEEPLPWAEWAAEFRAAMPEQIDRLMAEVAAGADSADHRQAWKERLKTIRELFRISKYRPAKKGEVRVGQQTVGGAPRDRDDDAITDSQRPSGGGGRAGGVYALFVDDEGEPGEEVRTEHYPDVQWITLAEKTRTPDLLEDRAAKYLPDQDLVQINGDFRVFTDMIYRWCERYSDVPGALPVVQQVVREWFEQALVETILGAQALKDSPQWDMNDIAHVWSEEALTAAVLQRYHIDVNVKRALGTKLGARRERAVA
jgi:hypothetical protein